MAALVPKRIIFQSLSATFAFILCWPSYALAWGYTGHRVIAEIAEQFLEPETAHKVRDLLAIENVSTLAEVSTWADQIRLQRPETAPWHYVNIPVHPAAGEPNSYDAARDCPNNACVVAQIERFERELADRELPERQRLEALKYLVHFIGDVHQPLHASNNQDRGGNEVQVTFMGHQTNLHAVWDTGVIEPAVRGDERGYALQLAQNITDAERKLWSSDDPVSWANDAYEIAVTEVYGKLPHAGVIPESYEVQALPIVNEQLAKAGVRLAAVLNKLLK
jgi:nuclease S1